MDFPVPISTRPLLVLIGAACCFFWLAESESPQPVECRGPGNTDCTIFNYLGEYPDRSQCKAAKVLYPRSEEELIAAVAEGTRKGQHMRVVSRGSHSIPKLVCPGGDGSGLAISTRDYDSDILVDSKARTATVDAGVRLKPFLDEVASYGLTFPHFPYWAGLSISGLLGTGAHGSGTWGKGSSVYEYVKSVRIVLPAVPEEGYAKVIELVTGVDDEIMNAVKVNLGVLGVISKVTLELQPMFKRSVSYVKQSDSGLESEIVSRAQKYEFGDVSWYPSMKIAVYREDNRVSTLIPGRGENNFTGFQPLSFAAAIAVRVGEETNEKFKFAEAKCVKSAGLLGTLFLAGYGFNNNGLLFTGFPVIGFQNNIAVSGICDDARLPGVGCSWDRRVKGTFYHQNAYSISFSKVPSFISDVKALVELRPDSLCGLGLYAGILLRYVKKSTGAYLGELEDGVDLDVTYFRSRDPCKPRLDEDVLEEIEQILQFKYGAKPHWGKNRPIGFLTTSSLYPDLPRFLLVKRQLDPRGLFSNDWTRAILNEEGAASVLQKVEPFCALEGKCICSQDSHCNPDEGYVCRPGLVYPEARVCRYVDGDAQ